MTTHSPTGRPVDTHRQVRQAEIFASQHRPGEPLLLLANACDVGSDAAIARAAASRLAVPLWINARTDIFLAGVGPAERRLAVALERAASYAAQVRTACSCPV